MNPLENHVYEIIIPKNHVLEDLDIHKYKINSSHTLTQNDNLLKLANHSVDCFRYHIIQGEILRFFVVMQVKNRSILTESAMKELNSIYPKLKFSMQILKNIDSKSSIEMNVPNIAKFLNNQTFNSEYEEKSSMIEEFIETPNLAYEYAVDTKNFISIFLLHLPILNSIEDLNNFIKFNLKITYNPIEIKEENVLQEIKKSADLIIERNKSFIELKNKQNSQQEKGEEIYLKYLEIIQKNLLKKQKKEFSIQIEKKVKLIHPLTITTENHQIFMKGIILIRVKNNLNSIFLKDNTNYTILQNLSSKQKSPNILCYQDANKKRTFLERDIQIYIKNIEFLLSNSSCKSIYNPKERESFFPGLAENFQIKVIGLENEQRLLYEDEFNIVITLDQLDYDNSKFIKTLPPLLLPCTKCQSEGIIESFTEVISRSNTEYLKNRANTAQVRLPDKMVEPLNFEYIKQIRKKSSLQQLHEINQEALSPSNVANKDETKKPNIQINTRKNIQTNNSKIETKCNCKQVINNGLNLLINTPLIIRWSFNDQEFCCSISKIIWSFKSSYILAVDISMDKTNFKKDEVIEFELTVKNNAFEDMELSCLMIDECIENNYKKTKSIDLLDSHKKSSIDTLPSALKKSPILRDINDVEVLDKIFSVISSQIQIMALSLQKDINFQKLKSGEKSTRRVRLLAIHPGLLKIDELIFHDKISDKFIKVGINLFITIE